MKAGTSKARAQLIVGAVALALGLVACGSSAASTAGASTAATSVAGAPASGAAVGTAGAGTVVGTASGPDGTYLTDKSGRALYLWVKDSRGPSQCSGSCAAVWPPLTTTSAPTATGKAVQADLGTSKRSDGTLQVTYHGWPLYYYAPDTRPGQTTGQGNDGFGATWWLVAPDGSEITGAASAPSSPAAGGGYGNGY